MKKIGILTNPTRDIGGEYRDYILASFPNIKFLLLENDDIEKLVKESNICITLGGDGTMLNIASLCAKYNTYIYGINLGSVGYLTDVSKEKGIEAIKKLLLENFEKEERMMIACDDYTALNDICIVKGSSSKMIILEIFIN
ncbi:MAG: NAD(+)/NADH kinase, partial [Defluviitaleaceae bacterium]|nr:NAD(+)/NADH kinase [Defluviitaleaceae bacterium]